MRINLNLNALNALRDVNKNSIQTGRSMEKLLSGLRINKSGDDAAGMVISEKMRMKIRGLEKVSRNIQDGISMVQTTEGALNEIHSVLQRMRELSIQASNETFSNDDRNKMQQEIDEMKGNITNIVNDTEFNHIKVLRPPVIEKTPISNAGKTDIVFIIDKTGSMQHVIDNVESNLETFFYIIGKCSVLLMHIPYELIKQSIGKRRLRF